ncbi:histidine kinase [Tistrella bauzanensis]|uniref:Histidine kinase n=1 Tax=Tistrella bauzanensis TaxID=657419 RepID=A0ABQ1J437_9PROT|nr:FecR domain-containing protein [Tistrella bauzanensis]GGB59584.1 histidine kinase [Tistrella bauzanensis]
MMAGATDDRGHAVTPPDHDQALRETAMDWLLRLHDAPADPALGRAFARWHAADPAHARAWLRACAAWRAMGEVPPQTGPAEWLAAEPAAPQVVHGRRGWRDLPRARRIVVAAAAMAAVLVLAIGGPEGLRRLRADHATGTGEVAHVVLDDGSVVDLAPETAIRVRLSDTGRAVTLISGEAYFAVAPDAGLPFTVTAGASRVTVTGTRFDVRLQPDTVSVAVESGAVMVGSADAGDSAAPHRLGAGDRLAVDRATGDARQSLQAPGTVAVWRDGRLQVTDATVAEVVADLRRYQPGWIVIADDRLAGRRISGSYDLRDPARALRAIVRPAGGTVRAVTPFLHVLSMP